MKVFLVAFLAAAAVAQPQWLNPIYNQGLYTGLMPSVYTHPQQVVYHQTPTVVKPVIQYEKDEKMPEMKEEMPKVEMYDKKEVEMKPIVYTTPFGHVAQPILPVQVNYQVPAKYHAKNGEVEHTVYKRDAEADPAWPYTTYGFPYTHQYAHQYASYMPYSYIPKAVVAPKVVAVPKVTYTKPVVTGEAKTVANDVFSPFGYAAKGQYHAENPGAVHVAKREADPLVYTNPLSLSTYAVGSHYTTPFTYMYQQPSVYHHPSVYTVPHVYTVPKVKTYANDAVKPEQYAAKNQYHAENAGAIHVAKRDAEADPAVLLKSYPYTTGFATPFVHRTLPYTGFNTGFYNRAAAVYPYYGF